MATFQSDLNLPDSRLVRYWRLRALNPVGVVDSSTSHLRGMIRDLQGQVKELERSLTESQRHIKIQEQRHIAEKDVLHRAFLRRK